VELKPENTPGEELHIKEGNFSRSRLKKVFYNWFSKDHRFSKSIYAP
jgi:hypothetical protein